MLNACKCMHPCCNEIELLYIFLVYCCQVSGKIPIPPRFAFGIYYSRYWAYSDFGDMVGINSCTYTCVLSVNPSCDYNRKLLMSMIRGEYP